MAGEQRRVSTDAMMWQVPALTLTAQSFLLTIVLGSTTTRAGAAIAGAVGVVIGIGALRQMLKHRHHEEALCRWLEAVEREVGLPTLHNLRRHGPLLTVAEHKTDIGGRWLYWGAKRGPTAAKIWAWILMSLAFLDFVLAVLSILGVIHSHK